MMRRGSTHDSVETVIAAASAIASAEGRVQPVSVQRRRWKSWFGMFGCFGCHGQPNRISKAVLVPEPIIQVPNAPTHSNSNLSLGQVIAPPSSPSSFLQSEPPSTTHSPAKFFSLSALARDSFSPTASSSIFAIGPYANDTRLVSPPVFSTFTTEPSTAPLTPPEPLQQTTPSSPEVPFAQLLSSTFDSICKKGDASYEFHPYHLQPGSPISHLISPSSVRSGASSPLPDLEFHSSIDGSVLFFPMPQPPKILSAEDLAMLKAGNVRRARDNGSILDGRITAVQPLLDDYITVHNEYKEDDISFEFTAQEVELRLNRRPALLVEVSSVSPRDLVETTPAIEETNGANSKLSEKLEHSLKLEALKDFKLNSEAENGLDKNWVFFSLAQPGVS